MGRELPQGTEEASDDEETVTKRLKMELSDGKLMVWADKDTQQFYEHLIDVREFAGATTTKVEGKEIASRFQHEINESIDMVDLTDIERDVEPDDPDISRQQDLEEPKSDGEFEDKPGEEG